MSRCWHVTTLIVENTFVLVEFVRKIAKSLSHCVAAMRRLSTVRFIQNRCVSFRYRTLEKTSATHAWRIRVWGDSTSSPEWRTCIRRYTVLKITISASLTCTTSSIRVDRQHGRRPVQTIYREVPPAHKYTLYTYYADGHSTHRVFPPTDELFVVCQSVRSSDT